MAKQTSVMRLLAPVVFEIIRLPRKSKNRIPYSCP